MGVIMAKSFLTYEQQIKKLVDDKNLIINDEEYATSVLKEIGYFALIGGYKDLFKNNTTKKYKDGTCFEDIVALYKFDENLRELFLKYLLKIERHIRSLISYYFCEKYGESQSYYLDKNNFSRHSKDMEDVKRLLGELEKLANHKSDYKYINHHRNTYGNVPLWVLFNGVTFGTISKFYMLMTQDLQFKVSREFQSLSEKKVRQILDVITKFRNVCAHNERLFSYKTKNAIPNLSAHKALNIMTKGDAYVSGIQDLFSVVISFKYLLSDEDFGKFKNSLASTIDYYIENTSALSENNILNAMGFPQNWKQV